MNTVFRDIGRFVRNCFIGLGILILLLIAGCIYYHSRRPHFSGTSVLAIDVRVSDPSSTNIYTTSITNRAACDAIWREFSQASAIFGGSQVVGDFTFKYANGKKDVVPFLPDPSFIWGGVFYRMPSERFYQVLKEGGVDISRIPKD